LANPDYTHVTLVVDRSGSMQTVAEEAQSGMNALLTSQFALPGRLTVTLVEFDSDIDTVMRMAKKRTEYVLEPRGMTRLLDAVGGELAATQADIKALRKAERPGQIIFVVVTDGEENSSSEHTLKGVRSEVDRLRKKSEWTFQFIGAGDSAWQGSEMGMNITSAPATAHGFRESYSTLNVRMAGARMPGGPRMSMPAFIRDDE
jgi:Mg-chelatase subunit ChlD